MRRLQAQQHLLKSRTEEKAIQEAEHSEPRPQSGDEYGKSQTSPFPPPHPSPHLLRNREASGAQILKLDSSKNRDFKGLQSKKRR